MSGNIRAALETLYTDRCTIYGSSPTVDATTALTSFVDSTLESDVPCRLSFERLDAAGGDNAASAQQGVKLFLPPCVDVPVGSHVSVNRCGRQLYYRCSGFAGLYKSHQEIILTAEEWA